MPAYGTSGGGGGERPPSPWLIDGSSEPRPHQTASFVEYLRWMRSPDHEYKDPTKVQILQKAEENVRHYDNRLRQLNKRTELLAGEGNSFQVKCAWRIRVGGHRGPESILLPAFDALGMPYIPSSTLRGVARTQAIRDIMAKNKLSWKEAEKQVAPWFGSLEAAKPGDRAGKVVFFDAYPIPGQVGLAVDMANNIWSWEGNSLKYSPNPNVFFSLKEPTFLIGVRLASGCNDTGVLDQVTQWLKKGLQAGIGSQVNTGYGELMLAGAGKPKDEFFRVGFTLKGQLIHGGQKFVKSSQPYEKDDDGHFKTDKNGRLKPDTRPDAEVRPVAFKSMLRYWFRAFALGVLSPDEVKEWERQLFGAINPSKTLGWVRFEILDGKVTQKEPEPKKEGRNRLCGAQKGVLTIAYSGEAPASKHESLKKLFEALTWMMFHLGGIGQGARRPCYSRNNRDRAPWWRGSTLYPEKGDEFWKLPDSPQEFQQLFRQRLGDFYAALGKLSGSTINWNKPNKVGTVNASTWTEAVDANCCILVCSGNADFGKPYALAVLHSDDLKVNGDYNGNLCGKVSGGVKPSPVWIADLGKYQVVTVFGATQDPRKQFVQKLKPQPKSESHAQIWPFT